jgi:predicted transcriptional regulator
MMTTLHKNILSELRQANALTTTEIAKAVNANRDVVQAALHDLDDEGHVIMRNGFYRTSEAAKVESK